MKYERKRLEVRCVDRDRTPLDQAIEDHTRWRLITVFKEGEEVEEGVVSGRMIYRKRVEEYSLIFEREVSDG